MNETEFAKHCVEKADKYGIYDYGSKAMPVNSRCFTAEAYDLNIFTAECNKLEYDVLPMEQSIFKWRTQSLVVQSMGYRKKH